MHSWATEELKYAKLPDKRLNQRSIEIVENLAQQPHGSVPQASGDWANTKATYNFWKSSRIKSTFGNFKATNTDKTSQD
ncbi:transposase DNA-binding-containing protein [Myxosarcina sp. GI1]|uniref:IS4/Tn5 family transposase DNA-binding protein n=1 Tax=Myxosarcina sp. GI1 TaxID=1541065 RepID=UPI000907D229|nr:transposase DNA-binding-containing protein [Myxosarcina sp. GI1]